MKKMLILVFLVIMIIPNFVEAKTLNDLYNQLAKLQTEYNTNKNNKQMTEAQVQKINQEISTINNSISTIRGEIKDAEKEIAKSKDDIESKKDETDGLVQFLQISNGGNIYLEYLFDAENYTDFIYRFEVVKQLTNYNSELIDELETLITNLQTKEKELEEKNVKLEKERNDLNSKLVVLQASMKNYMVEGTNIADDIKYLEEQIKKYENKGCDRYEDLDACEVKVIATGWRYPLAYGCVTSEYTGDEPRYDAYGGHHYGIDLSCIPEGTKVYPVADGVVARIVHKYRCGGNMIYINHNVNGKKYTTAYMHLLKFASNMYVDKVVTTNDVIGYVGGYSTADERGGHDYCTTGTHLHLGMAEGYSATSFQSHSFNPREIFPFPKLIYNGGGYFYR